ncbi:MAG: ATP-binding protein [Paludibacteraceae bacterium]|nr:ATP-binding protein [Paludibacteraceae bacterium]
MATNIYLSRAMEPLLLEASQYFPVVSVTGPRQSGKSTLLKHCFPSYKYVSMKDVHLREYALQDPIAFLNQTTEGLLIDEVQKVPQLVEYIQGIVDADSSRKFALTGSSNFELLKSLTESLAGRTGIYELLPMSLEELKDEHSLSVNQRLYNGFYPAVIAQKNKASLYYPAYIRTYLEKDVRDLLQVQNQMLFLKFIKLCAGRIGSIFNASQIANEVGVDSKTIAHWLSVLQASYIIYLLPPYFENISKRVVKSPKLYFTDPGLACYLLDIEKPNQLDHDKMRGALFENMIVMECVKHRMNQGKEGGVFFYRDSNQNEVDILIKQSGQLIALEVKSAMTYNPSFASSLLKLPQWTDTPIAKRAVVYSGDFENPMGDIALINYEHLASIL